MLDGYTLLSCADIARMSALRLLDLGACTHTEESFEISVDIQYLRWSTQRASTLPSSLIVLDLSGSHSLTALPESIAALSGLQILELNYCKSLIALPEGISGLCSLQTLEMGMCTSLAGLPQGISGLISLHTLDLWSCTSLATLPEGIHGSSGLQDAGLAGLHQPCRPAAGDQWARQPAVLTDEGMQQYDSSAARDKWPEQPPRSWTLQGCTSLAALPQEISGLSSLTGLYA